MFKFCEKICFLHFCDKSDFCPEKYLLGMIMQHSFHMKYILVYYEMHIKVVFKATQKNCKHSSMQFECARFFCILFDTWLFS